MLEATGSRDVVSPAFRLSLKVWGMPMRTLTPMHACGGLLSEVDFPEVHLISVPSTRKVNSITCVCLGVERFSVNFCISESEILALGTEAFESCLALSL